MKFSVKYDLEYSVNGIDERNEMNKTTWHKKRLSASSDARFSNWIGFISCKLRPYQRVNKITPTVSFPRLGLWYLTLIM